MIIGGSTRLIGGLLKVTLHREAEDFVTINPVEVAAVVVMDISPPGGSTFPRYAVWSGYG
jgi:hypothetical protein